VRRICWSRSVSCGGSRFALSLTASSTKREKSVNYRGMSWGGDGTAGDVRVSQLPWLEAKAKSNFIAQSRKVPNKG
jgi:hypothetical protein